MLGARCQDEDIEDVENDSSSYGNFGDYEPPTKQYSTDPKIISRDVKCLGELVAHFPERS